MNIKYAFLIGACIVVAFVLWSVFDTVCKPCIIPPDAPDNAVCPSVCYPEPRWTSWFRDYANLF